MTALASQGRKERKEKRKRRYSMGGSGPRSRSATPRSRRRHNVHDVLAKQERDEQRLRDSEERYRALIITERKQAEETRARLAAIVEFSEDAILSKDLNGVITSWNRGAERLFGYTAAEAVGQPITLIVPPDRLDEEARILDLVGQRLPIEHYETQRRHKDGRLLDFSLTVSPISDASGNITGASTIARDITERKQTEESLAKRANEQAALYQFTDRMHRADSIDEVYNSALDAITDALKCERASILLFDEGGVMRFVGWKELSDAYRKAVDGHSPWKAGEKEAQPICINDIDTADISPSLREVVKREAIRALAFIPLMSNGWVIGKFMVYHSTPHVFSQDEVDLALNVARQLGVAIERKRAEEALLRSEKHVRQELLELEAIYRTAPLGFAVFDTQLRFRRVNQRVAEMNGLPIEEHIGKTVREVVPSLAEQAEHVLQELLKKRAPVRFEFRGETRAQPGVEGVWDEHWYPLIDSTGQVAGVGVVIEDITERHRAEVALRESENRYRTLATNLEQIVTERTRDLRTTNEQLEAFVYSIAHDLRTPLRALTGYSQLLLSGRAGTLNASARNLLDRIQASSEFMDKLLLDLLAYGRAASAEVELGPVEVRKAWESACFQCAQQIKEAQAKINTQEPLPVVRAHEGTLGQCLANLLSNALKFVPPERQPEVCFRSENRGQFERLWVEDNGMGIPPEHRERIFRVFERLHGSRYVGTGIGLSIVRKGVERMGGHLGLESEPGKGSKFWIELPKAA